MDQQSVCAMTTEPTVILVNQISRHGHLDSYAKLYSRCLLDLGYRVVLIAEHDPRTRGRLREDGAELDIGFTFFSRDQLRAEIEREFERQRHQSQEQKERQLRLEQERQSAEQERQSAEQKERQLVLERRHQLRLEQQYQLELERERHQLRLGQDGTGASGSDRPSRIEICIYQLTTQFPILARARLVWHVEGVGGILHRTGLYLRWGLALVTVRPLERRLNIFTQRFPIVARAWLVWRAEGLRGIANRMWLYLRWGIALVTLRPAKRCLNGLAQRFPALVRVQRVWSNEGTRGLAIRLRLYSSRFVRKVLSATGIDIALPRLFATVDVPALGVDFGPIVDEICAAERLLGYKPVLVLFLYLDMMSEGRAGCSWLESHLDTPWGGILFHPRVTDGAQSQSAGVERYFLCRNARGAVFLNPGSVPVYRRILPKLFFAAVPDVTETAMLPGSFDMAQELHARAQGRTIVLQFGSLGPHKGVVDLVDVISMADSRHYFFAIVGEVFWDSYEAEDAEKLRNFFASPPENCFVQFGYLDDERQLNALIASVDILYAVYRGVFRDSCNTLTKGAFFEKPVIVSDQYLVGERVRGFRLGAAVQSGDAKSILAGLENVRLRPKAEFGFAAYRQDHSIEALKSALSRALDCWSFR